jgi:hypothetical protein
MTEAMGFQPGLPVAMIERMEVICGGGSALFIDGSGLQFDCFTPDGRHRLGLYASAQHIGRDSYFDAEHHVNHYGRTEDNTFVSDAQYACTFERLLLRQT